MNSGNYLPPLKINNPRVLNTALLISLISIASSILTTMVFKPTDKSMVSMIVSIVIFAISIAVLFQGMNNYRNTELEGYMPFSRGLGYAVLVGIVVGIVSAIFTYILYKFINPGLITEMTNLQYAEMEKRGLSQEDIEKAQSMMGWAKSPGFIAIMALFGSVMIYFVVGLICSAILKRWPRPYTDDTDVVIEKTTEEL
jgi:hypothetical protein